MTKEMVMIGDLVDRVNGHMYDHAPTEALEAWVQLLDVLSVIVELLDKKPTDGPICICAWCRMPAMNMEELQAHILECEHRPKG